MLIQLLVQRHPLRNLSVHMPNYGPLHSGCGAEMFAVALLTVSVVSRPGLLQPLTGQLMKVPRVAMSEMAPDGHLFIICSSRCSVHELRLSIEQGVN